MAGKYACIYQGHAFLTSQFLSITSLFFMTIDRFLLAYTRYRITTFHVISGILSAFAASLVMYLSINFLPQTEFFFALQSSRLYCIIPCWSENLFIQIVVVVFCFVLVFMMTLLSVTYYKIFSMYSAVMQKKKNKKERKGSSNSQTAIYSLKEWTLLKKCIALTGAFYICYTPILCKFIVEFITKTPIHPALDTVGFLCALLGSFVNVSTICCFDFEVQRDLRILFGMLKESKIVELQKQRSRSNTSALKPSESSKLPLAERFRKMSATPSVVRKPSVESSKLKLAGRERNMSAPTAREISLHDLTDTVIIAGSLPKRTT